MLNHMECAAHYKRLIIQTKCKNKDDDCAICLMPLLNKRVTYLPCRHYFHHECLNQSIENKIYTCSLCRYSLVEALLQIGLVIDDVNDVDSHNFWFNLLANIYANDEYIQDIIVVMYV